MVTNSDSGRVVFRETGNTAAVATDELIAEVARAISECRRVSALRDADEIGRIILNRFFSGNPQLWRSHRPDKDTSLRKLASRLEGGFTQSKLRRCVRIHLVSLEHPKLAESVHVTAGHADEVYGLDFNQRNELLARAEGERWSIEKLRLVKRQALQEATGTRRSSPGRPVSPPEFKAMTRLMNALGSAEQALVLLDTVTEAHPEAQAALSETGSKILTVTARVLEIVEGKAGGRHPNSRGRRLLPRGPETASPR